MWLASPEAEITGRVFNVKGGLISVAEGGAPVGRGEDVAVDAGGDRRRAFPSWWPEAKPNVDAAGNPKV